MKANFAVSLILWPRLNKTLNRKFTFTNSAQLSLVSLNLKNLKKLPNEIN